MTVVVDFNSLIIILSLDDLHVILLSPQAGSILN
jgi:hypothetical protein